MPCAVHFTAAYQEPNSQRPLLLLPAVDQLLVWILTEVLGPLLKQRVGLLLGSRLQMNNTRSASALQPALQPSAS
jgi:hypothetical protein